jgi:hypothetical protein
MDQRTDIGNLSHFSRGLLDLLDRVEYRRIVTREDMEAVGRLRARSFARSNVLEKQLGDSLIEDVDYDPNAYVFGVFVDERLVSTIRLHLVTPSHRVGSSTYLFGDILNPLLDSGMSFIDPSRFATDYDFHNEFRGLPYLTLRVATMASVYFDVNGSLASCDASHSAFYKRVFGFRQLAEPRELPGIRGRGVLLVEDLSNRVDVARRYPVFKSHPYEQRLMFDRDAQECLAPLSILPTARYADLASFNMPASLFAR